MLIIPVLDLKDGIVVHAKQGQRDRYAPINSPLCQGSGPEQVVAAYLRLHAFTTFYIADLNAIAGNHDHQPLLNRLLAKFPQLTFWIDSGYQTSPGYFHRHDNYVPVLGSESYTSADFSALAAFQQNYILSLDFSGALPLGAEQLFAPSSLWPKNIIIMTLQRVGSNQGPDIEKLQGFVKHYAGYSFIAAGGIRNLADLKKLNNAGINTALLASALHAGAISTQDLHYLHSL